MDQLIASLNTILIGICMSLGSFLWIALTRRNHLPEDQQFTSRQATIRGVIFYVAMISGVLLFLSGMVQIVT